MTVLCKEFAAVFGFETFVLTDKIVKSSYRELGVRFSIGYKNKKALQLLFGHIQAFTDLLQS